MIEPFTVLTGTTFVLPQSDIDTDQIIPARFLTTTVREGLGQSLFADWRYDSDGREIADAPLNSDAARSASILVAGNNFGCGSSREHAPWALLDFGFRVVISTEIADIFRSNSLKNGLLPIVVDRQTHAQLLAEPGVTLTVDLENRAIALPDGETIGFDVDGFSRYCLMNGIDQLGFLLEQREAIAAYEERTGS